MTVSHHEFGVQDHTTELFMDRLVVVISKGHFSSWLIVFQITRLILCWWWIDGTEHCTYMQFFGGIEAPTASIITKALIVNTISVN
jgi:hypothetical protein